jgi:hypothetical protein
MRIVQLQTAVARLNELETRRERSLNVLVYSNVLDGRTEGALYEAEAVIPPEHEPGTR